MDDFLRPLLLDRGRTCKKGCSSTLFVCPQLHIFMGEFIIDLKYRTQWRGKLSGKLYEIVYDFVQFFRSVFTTNSKAARKVERKVSLDGKLYGIVYDSYNFLRYCEHHN